MLADAFHEKRWDYLYSEQPGGEDRVQKRVSLFFNGENLMGVQGDFRPSSMPVVKESTETSVDVPKRDLERSMWEKISGLFGNDEPDTFARRNNQNASEPKEASSSSEKGKELIEDDTNNK
jgi:outer membrane protein assembly factor BamE